MKVCIITLGCKVNQYESNQMARTYITDGHEVVHKFDPTADLFIINSCAVTNFAVKKSRYQVARAKRANPNAEIIFCGCSADRALNKSMPSKTFALQPRTRAFIKVQDGCDNFCSYCIVPHIRGRSTSRPIEDILEEVKSTSKSIVFTGIDLSSFNNLSLLCTQTNALGNQFELSSMEVGIITPDFLQTLKDCQNFIPNFHVPLQSGSTKVLKDMNRKYTAEQYLEKITLIRNHFPNAKITTDIIVGFPTETEQDFNQSLNIVQQANFEKIHIFPYSKRPGTAAEKFQELQPSIITKRVKLLSKFKANS